LLHEVFVGVIHLDGTGLRSAAGAPADDVQPKAVAAQVIRHANNHIVGDRDGHIHAGIAIGAGGYVKVNHIPVGVVILRPQAQEIDPIIACPVVPGNARPAVACHPAPQGCINGGTHLPGARPLLGAGAGRLCLDGQRQRSQHARHHQYTTQRKQAFLHGSSFLIVTNRLKEHGKTPKGKNGPKHLLSHFRTGCNACSPCIPRRQEGGGSLFS